MHEFAPASTLNWLWSARETIRKSRISVELQFRAVFECRSVFVCRMRECMRECVRASVAADE